MEQQQAERERPVSVKRAGLVGVTGYTGMELVRILATHPLIRLTRVTSRKRAGASLASVYPSLQGFSIGELTITEPSVAALAASCDVVFLAVPHGAAMTLGAQLVRSGCKVVDLSADFRIRDRETYEAWYNVKHTEPGAL